MDALTLVQTYHFHTIRKISHFSQHLFVGDVWKPDFDIFIIGWMPFLLCLTNNRTELYLNVSRSESLLPEHYFRGLKTDFLFYAQRDNRQEPQGIGDLSQPFMLPAGSGFQVLKDEPVYIKCGVMNKGGRQSVYDLACVIYWVEIMSQEHRHQPLEVSTELNEPQYEPIRNE